MDESDTRPRLQALAQVLVLVLVTLAVYAHSLFHAPRADQLIYLYQTAPHHGLADLVTRTYALNRALPMGDQILFRPLLYVLLAVQRWAWGLDFLPWQATSLALHVAVVLSLFQHLRLVAGPRALLPLAGALFHATLYAGMEMVIWQHIVGYLLFCLGLVRAATALHRLLRGAPAPGATRDLIGWGAVAAFSYELGNVVAVVFSLALLHAGRADPARRPLRRAAFALLLIPAAYAAWSALDYWLRFRAAPTLGGTPGGAPGVSPVSALLTVCARWTAETFFPTALVMRVVERMHSRGLMLLAHPGADLQIWANIGLTLLVGLCAARLAWLRRRQVGVMPAALLLVLLAYLAILVIGRGTARGLNEVLGVSPYYIYTFALLLIMTLMSGVAPAQAGGEDHGSRLREARRLSRALALGLLGIGLLSGVKTWEMNARVHHVHGRPRRQLVSAVQALRQAHGAEPGFSISVSPACAANHPLPWFATVGRGERRAYRYLSVLFPALIKDPDPDDQGDSGGAYRISCAPDGTITAAPAANLPK